MWLFAFITSFIAILIGGCIAWLLKRFQKEMDTTYAICAGLIFGLISIEILPEAIEIGDWVISFLGIFLGFILFKGLHSIFHFNQSEALLSKEKRSIRTGLLLMFSIAIHNFPIGIMIGTNLEAELTIPLLQTLFFHSIPEGVILFTVLMVAGTNVIQWLTLNVFVSIPVALGVYIGNYIRIEFQLLSAFLISFTIGIMVTVTVTEILFAAFKKSSTVKIVLFTFVGFGIMGLYLYVI
ncbi:ZIP family metal transporter [Lysinibacillus antri]|uniref:Divalent cation transporter n=1 Tax=Lysinibacillus antri TaxID=2498145 RepID=A0A3S0RW13_9BACI|nr:ZIP family metal transporter [Lysinibacillus antri]RUL53542.1 divalent cation transporter [Lysinibacillus antri]